MLRREVSLVDSVSKVELCRYLKLSSPIPLQIIFKVFLHVLPSHGKTPNLNIHETVTDLPDSSDLLCNLLCQLS